MNRAMDVPRFAPIPALVVSVLLAAPAASPAELVDRVAAVVNNEVVTLSEVRERAGAELARARGEERDALTRRVLDTLIGEKLLEGAIRELSIEVSPQEVELGIEDVRQKNNVGEEQFEALLRSEGYTVAQYREVVKKQLAKLKLLNLKVRQKVKVSEEDLRAEYARVAKLDEGDAEVRVRHLVVLVDRSAAPGAVEAARQKAAALAEEARRPGVDFATLAKAKSEGPSAADGGDLGFFKRGVMLPEFERVAFTLQEGQISDPVRTNFGFHVLKVEERRAVGARPFEELKEQLRERLTTAQLERYTDQYVQELRAAGSVEVKL